MWVPLKPGTSGTCFGHWCSSPKWPTALAAPQPRPRSKAGLSQCQPCLHSPSVAGVRMSSWQSPESLPRVTSPQEPGPGQLGISTSDGEGPNPSGFQGGSAPWGRCPLSEEKQRPSHMGYDRYHAALALLERKILFSCWYRSNSKASFYSDSSKLLAAAPNRLRAPKLGCSCWGGDSAHAHSFGGVGGVGGVLRGVDTGTDTRPPSSASPGGAQRRQGISTDKGPWHSQGPGPTPAGCPARSHVRQPPPGTQPKICLPEPRYRPAAAVPVGQHLTGAPWLGGKGKLLPGTKIFFHPRMDAGSLRIAGINESAPRVWIRAGWHVG